MALGDYSLCDRCNCKLIYDGDRDNRDWLIERFGKEPEFYCPDCQPEDARDAARFRWALPILTGVDSEMADSRALLIAFQLARGLDGGEAIDTAMQQEQKK